MQIDFKNFLALWNQIQRQKTPNIHFQMAEFLEQNWRSEKDVRLLLMAFRSAGKSTLIGAFAAWLIYTNPNVRILVLAADTTLAGKMVRNVKRIIERHPLTTHLKPDRIDQWAADRFTVNRDMELRDPSMLARGITGNITGSRADIVICDDVEVPNTCDSVQKREDLRLRLTEIPYVLVAGGAQIYVGTPHNYLSIYADTPREEVGEEAPFLDGFQRMNIPILDIDGNPTWPQKYTPESIEQMKIDTGPNKFESQMMLKPVNIIEGRLDVELLQFYGDEIEYCKITDALYMGSLQIVDMRCWWDPSFAAAKSDDSVLAIVMGDRGGNYYLHHLEYIKLDETNEEDEATQQAKIVTALAKKYHVPCISVETNGIGKFLPSILRKELDAARVMTAVDPQTSTKNKAQRILEGFDAVLAAKKLFVHERIKQTNFLMQMREWRPGKSKCKDDALDAVSSAILAHPARTEKLNRNMASRRQSWRPNAKTHRIKGEFEL